MSTIMIKLEFTYLIVTFFVKVKPFMLDGSVASYAQFQKWNVAVNGSLEFEFKTQQGNGLLLYTDDGGMYDFFEIKLVESAVRLRYNLGGGAQIVTVGRDLSDGQWHKIQIFRDNENTTLKVDTLSAVSTSRGKEFEFGRLSSNSDVYIGGMPSWYNSKLTLLALPSVIFEPKFRGQIRNIIYADDNDYIPRRQETIGRSYRSILNAIPSNETDSCDSANPCQHDGICISTDDGPICQCRNDHYEGDFCEKDKLPAEAAFKGTEYLKFIIDKAQPILSHDELISFYFKSRQHNGFLFYSDDNENYLIVTLKDGGIAVSMVLMNGRLDLQIKPAKIRFDDNQWHKISIQRRVQEISPITRFCKLSAIIDGLYAEHAHTAGSFSHLTCLQFLIGGGAENTILPKKRGIPNFVGCIKEVLFRAENYEIEIIDAVKNKLGHSTAWGNVEFLCREFKSDPITFTSRDSHIVLPPLKPAKSESISFKIRTTESNGLIMISHSGTALRPDLLSFELLSGYLCLHINLGSGHSKICSSNERLDNGTWHDVSLRRVNQNGRMTVDKEVIDFYTKGNSKQLDTDGLLYIGGIAMISTTLSIPPVVWTASLRQGYIGCMRDLIINGIPVDIARYAQQQDSGAVRPACHIQSLHCSSQPCMHGGTCIDGWNRFYCDCTATSYIGPICGKAASTLHLNGSQQLIIVMPDDSITEAEEISLRFKTLKSHGLLIKTSLDDSPNHLEILLEKGIVNARIQVNGVKETLMSGQGLNDETWHTMKFSRRAQSIKLWVDDEPVSYSEMQPINNAFLKLRTLCIGGDCQNSGSVHNFAGQIQQLWFNGQPYIEIARSFALSQYYNYNVTPIIRVTGNFEKRTHPIHHSVTFTSKHTFVGLPVLRAYIETNIHFQFKTWESNGLILFNGGKEKDYIAVELIDGHIHYTFDLGDGPIRMKDNLKSRLNDGKWHAVSIERPSPKKHTLAIDDHTTLKTIHGDNENLDLDGLLYIGGVEKLLYDRLPSHILSRHGFVGCIASLDVSGESIDLLIDAVVPSTLVESGCSSYTSFYATKRCSQEKCFNNGKCIQKWNSITCDCDMTSFVGEKCENEAVAYEFGPGRGLITYTFPTTQRPESKKDSIALGFITSINDAVLLRIDSATSADYLEIGITEGNIFTIFNVGTMDHPISETTVKVNDNQYHIMRFLRNGANSTLQVDDYDLQSSHPSGHQLTIFNSQSIIQVGGKWNKSNARVEKPFQGVISGLVVNGARILELAAGSENEVVVTIKGDVQPITPGSLLDKTISMQRMQQTPASGTPGIMDDLIFSGAGSGCVGDDEDDDCTPVYDPNSDDLITPIYKQPTKSPDITKSRSKNIFQEHLSCDDDEDCFDGSGDLMTTQSVSTLVESNYTENEELLSNHTIMSTPLDLLTTIDNSVIVWSTDALTQIEETTAISVTPEHRLDMSTLASTTVTGVITKLNSKDYPSITISPKAKDVPKTPSIQSDAAKNAALIIAIIAAALIAIVLVILLILKFKNRPDADYKIEETRTFCHDPNVALLGTISSRQSHNGSLKSSSSVNKTNKKREMKDIKEWYV
ncbi:neurexin-3 isoform X2 [Chelonus insularis]|uniref:neurexin-3 isoform X2 n=1 Tax=Chelonus insularis TaxID=460826 RepID=UPI00158AEB98|nr:neurexin-3 isoform X2 [Chelonus insularis]